MNKRIKELITQAGGHWNHGDFNMPSSVEFQEQDIEKFARLIVRECMNICAEREEDIRTRIKDEGKAATAYMIRAYIKEHFGVEE